MEQTHSHSQPTIKYDVFQCYEAKKLSNMFWGDEKKTITVKRPGWLTNMGCAAAAFVGFWSSANCWLRVFLFRRQNQFIDMPKMECLSATVYPRSTIRCSLWSLKGFFKLRFTFSVNIPWFFLAVLFCVCVCVLYRVHLWMNNIKFRFMAI